MNNLTSQKNIHNGRSHNLLSSILTVQQTVRDGLNDQELTQLLYQQQLPSEGGFVFLNFAEQFVTLGVPPQRLEDWYPEEGWITPEKERVGREIAARHNFSFWQPPDYFSPPAQNDSLKISHHIEFSNDWQTIVSAHPYYLKVRLLTVSSSMLHLRDVERPLKLNPGLLMDLSALFQTRRLDSVATTIGLGVLPEEGPSRHAFFQPGYSFETFTGVER